MAWEDNASASLQEEAKRVALWMQATQQLLTQNKDFMRTLVALGPAGSVASAIHATILYNDGASPEEAAKEIAEAAQGALADLRKEAQQRQDAMQQEWLRTVPLKRVH